MTPEPISPAEARWVVLAAVLLMALLYGMAMWWGALPPTDQDEDPLTPEQVARLEAQEKARQHDGR
ncbi:MAG: hypothetical protein IPK12_23370 [Gemmatimonadetes bacterium]|nr:hypothetical protein [Gemmatimonadota bacterium]